MKLLFTPRYSEDKLQRIRDLGYEILYLEERNLYNDEEVNECEVMVTYNPFRTLDISEMKKLKYIQTTSIGIDQIPIEEVKQRNITVANNKGGYSIPMAEWIVMYILQIYKNSFVLYEQQKNKKWAKNLEITELTNKKIGFIGTGTISSEAAKRLKPFNVEILGMNTNGRDTKYFDKCFSNEDINEIFMNCDVVVSAIPSTKKTIGMIDKSKFDLMKEGSVFINVGRGDLVNEKDLEKSIHKFRGVALDVVEKEPLSKESNLWSYENVIITPHNSWYSDKNNDRNFEMIYENLKNYIQNKNIKNIVDLNKGY